MSDEIPHHELLQSSLPKRVRSPLNNLPLSRDAWLMLLIAVNEIFLGLDTYLSHRISGTIVPNEWIPIYFGPLAGILLILAGILSFRYRKTASLVAGFVLLASFVVGVLGSYFHFHYAVRPGAPPGHRMPLSAFVWAPPVLAPLAFSLVGWFGLSAVWKEDPPGSGRLNFLDLVTLRLPYSKTRAYLFIVAIGILIATLSSVLDHARSGFEDPWMWFATGAGIFSTVVTAGFGLMDHPERGDVYSFLGVMVLLCFLGPLGLLFHTLANLTPEGEILVERFIRGAPFMAPLLFSNMGFMGLLVLLPPQSDGQ